MPLREITSVQQVLGSGLLRWFASSEMDLFLWLGDGDELLGFQFSYDKQHGERALAWNARTGFTHDRVDDGEGEPGARYKGAPLMREGGKPDVERIVGLLSENRAAVPPNLFEAMLAKIRQSPTVA